MKIFPAIDLYGGKAVRLLRGDYARMTEYGDPEDAARLFAGAGAEYVHIVDLEGARDGTTANFSVIGKIVSESGLKAEVGGGVRSAEVVKKYLDAGAMRVILGTAAVSKPGFAAEMAKIFGERVAVGVDILDGHVAVKGWTEISNVDCFDFCRSMEEIGIKTIICTDISKDGALGGTNLDLYGRLSRELDVDIVASGGISSLSDVRELRNMGLYGAILGRAVYTGDIDLKTAITLAGEAEGGK